MPDDHGDAVSVCFVVTIDGHGIGPFSSCEGLGAEVVIEEREEGGENGMVHQLPTRMRYPTIKLTRPITKSTAEVIPRWLSALAHGVVPTTGTIEARTAAGEKIMTWSLKAVVPVRWTGPQFSVDSPKVASETLELAHHGFTGAGWGG